MALVGFCIARPCAWRHKMSNFSFDAYHRQLAVRCTFLQNIVTCLSRLEKVVACCVFYWLSKLSSISKDGFWIEGSSQSGTYHCPLPFVAVTVAIVVAEHRWSYLSIWVLIRTCAFVHSSSLKKMKSMWFRLLKLVLVLSVRLQVRQMSLKFRSAYHARSSGDPSNAWWF